MLNFETQLKEGSKDQVRFPHLIKSLLILYLLLLSGLLLPKILKGQGLDRPPLVSGQNSEVDYYPAHGHRSSTNPSAFIWLPDDRADRYILQYSQSQTFDPVETVTVRDLDITVHVPTELMEPGTWYWRYGYNDGERDHFSRKRRYEIPETATPFPFIPAEEVIERIPRHRPRLGFTPEQVEEIRSDTQGRFSPFTGEVIKEAEEILAINESLFEEPDPWEEYDDPNMAYVNAWRSMRPYTQRMVTSALAYVYTGDERFAAEARRRLLHFMTWDVEGPSRAIPPAELGMDIAENATPVFDWIYDALSEEEQEKCKRVLASRMKQISYDVHRSRPMETRPYSSHQNRMMGFVLEGSIVLAHDVPEVADWLDYTMKLMWSTYPPWGYSDGGWHQGISYWGSYIQRMIRAVAELDRYGIPIKEKPFFQNTGWFGLYAAYPNRPTRAFGDGQAGPVGEAHGRLMYALSSLYQNPYFRWHAETSNATPTGRDALLHYDPDLPASPPDDLPQSRAFKDVGIVAMHSNMSDPDDNVMMLFRSDPIGAFSHNFPAQNAFVIEAFGEPLAISTGSRQLHGSPHHSQWMWSTYAHNSLLVDGEGQVIRDPFPFGRIVAYEEQGGYVYTMGDASEAYINRLERFDRHVLFVRPDYFVIIDDLETKDNVSTFQWLLHSPTEMQVDRSAQIVVNRSGNVRLTTRFLTPGSIDFSQHTGFTPQVEHPERFRNQFHLTASTTRPATSQRFVTVMKVDRISGMPAAHPEPPTTERREITIQDIENRNTLDQTVIKAKLLEARGGIAVRVGDDLVLWKDPDSWRVEAAGTNSTVHMTVKQDYFR